MTYPTAISIAAFLRALPSEEQALVRAALESYASLPGAAIRSRWSRPMNHRTRLPKPSRLLRRA